MASKKVSEIRPFLSPQLSGGNTEKLRVIFWHTNVALRVQNRVHFAWAKEWPQKMRVFTIYSADVPHIPFYLTIPPPLVSPLALLLGRCVVLLR